MQKVLNELLLLLEGAPQWLISYGRQKQPHLHGPWLPVELGLSLPAHGILFEGKRRKHTVKLPGTIPLPPINQSHRPVQAKQTEGAFSAFLSFRLS